MNSKKLIFSITAIVIAGITLLLFYPKTKSSAVLIPLPLEKTMIQLKEGNRVQLWFHTVQSKDSSSIHFDSPGRWKISKDGYSLKIITADTYTSALELSDGNQKLPLIYQARIDSMDYNQTIVSLHYKSNLFRKLTGEPPLQQAAIESLQQLEAFTNNNKQFYGYEIRHSGVSDSAFLFSTRSVPANGIQSAAINIFDELIGYAKKNKIQFNGNKIINIFLLPADSIRVSGGIAVNSYYVPGKKENIAYKNMPYGKKLLEAPFKGSYLALPDVFEALSNYAYDHRLTKMAIPYAKFLSEQYQYADNDMIDFMVYLPVD